MNFYRPCRTEHYHLASCTFKVLFFPSQVYVRKEIINLHSKQIKVILEDIILIRNKKEKINHHATHISRSLQITWCIWFNLNQYANVSAASIWPSVLILFSNWSFLVYFHPKIWIRTEGKCICRITISWFSTN